MRRVLVALVLGGGVLLVSAAPASATFTKNTVGCKGSAVITDKDGKTFSIDAADSKVKVPKEGSAAWQGSLGTVTHNHSGSVSLKVGLAKIELGSWGPSANASNQGSQSGVKEIPAAVKQLLPGKYVVSGSHNGDEGGCAGSIVVEVEGSALGTPAGIGVLIGTVVTGAGLAFVALGKAAA
jgi:hypothetical protein